VRSFSDLERWFEVVLKYLEAKNQKQWRSFAVETIRKIQNRLVNLTTRYRPYAPNLFRRTAYPMTEPSLLPSVSYPMDPMLGYQPVSEWNSIPSQPKFIETPR